MSQTSQTPTYAGMTDTQTLAAQNLDHRVDQVGTLPRSYQEHDKWKQNWRKYQDGPQTCTDLFNSAMALRSGMTQPFQDWLECRKARYQKAFAHANQESTLYFEHYGCDADHIATAKQELVDDTSDAQRIADSEGKTLDVIVNRNMKKDYNLWRSLALFVSSYEEARLRAMEFQWLAENAIGIPGVTLAATTQAPQANTTQDTA